MKEAQIGCDIEKFARARFRPALAAAERRRRPRERAGDGSMRRSATDVWRIWTDAQEAMVKQRGGGARPIVGVDGFLLAPVTVDSAILRRRCRI